MFGDGSRKNDSAPADFRSFMSASPRIVTRKSIGVLWPSKMTLSVSCTDWLSCKPLVVAVSTV